MKNIKFGGASLMAAIDQAENIVTKAIGFIGRPDKKGGYLCIMDLTCTVIAVFLVGSVKDRIKAKKYMRLCQEKALRLGKHPDHLSSWQSRNEKAGKWGGAIRAGKYIISFSGLPEHWDEACMTCLAVKAFPFRIRIHNVEKIWRISDNPFIVQLLANC